MTAIWRSGAEIAPNTSETEFSSGDFTNAAWVTTPVHAGTYALKFQGVGHAAFTFPTPLPGAAARFYFLRDSASMATATRICVFGSGVGHLGSLTLRTDFALELNLNGYPGAETVLAVSSVTVPLSTWVCLELWVDPTTGVISTRYNGTEWVRTAATFAYTGTVVYAVFGPDEAAPTGCNLYYDDMAINSLAGPYNNGWPGPSEGVLTFRPSANADVVGWTPHGAATVYECLDDLVPDATTTYIDQTTGTVGTMAGVYFPAWPVSVPAACAMIGLIGSSAGTTSIAVNIYDPSNAVISGATTLSLGWQRRYPLVTAERAWDGTRRLLNNGYLMPSSGTRSRVVIVRTDSIVDTQYVTTLWMTVDFPLALAAAPVPVGLHEATILAEMLP